ncbi:MAG: chemotaxis protein CheW [Acidimicrobiales bacterium]
MDGVDEIVAEFLVESYENLDQLAQELVELEHNPTGRELLASIFRSIHTIKGTSGFLGFSKLEKVTHVGESLLSRLRDGLQLMTPEIADALLAMSDVVNGILQSIEKTGEEGDVDNTALIARLTALQSDSPPPEPAPSEVADPATEVDAGTEVEAGTDAGGEQPTDDGGHRKVGEILVDSGLVSSAEVTLAVHEQELGDPRVLGEILATHGAATTDEVDAIIDAVAPLDPGPAGEVPTSVTKTPAPADVVPAQPTSAVRPPAPPTAPAPVPAAAIPAAAAAPAGPVRPPAPPSPAAPATASAGDAPASPKGPPGGAGGPSLSTATVRVDVRLLDELMNLVGELVLARNQIMEYNTGQRTPMAAAAQRLDLITTELQARVMTTRMQPIGSAWNRFPRLVRDVSAACNKSVRLEMEGAETELDRSLIESITDPLTHIVRNSVDHGIETPADRVAKGKPAEGRLLLRAFHEDGQVVIEIRDDGAGIDSERIKAKAIEKGQITPDQAARMSERDALDLIFLAGLSTAAAITNISGRGVGMDVVKTNVEKINGVLDIESKVGVGTTIKIKIPLTLAIIPALVINCHEDRYAIPQGSVIELVRLQPEQARSGIELLHGVPVYRLRGNLLPLVYLREQIGLPNHDPSASVAIVVLAARDRMFGLVVDGVHNTEEIVVKPLARQLKSIPVYAGATIMGDGKVALILDVVGIAMRSRVIIEMRSADGADIGGPLRHALRAQTVPVVLVEGFAGERQAIPLRSVSRLETLHRDNLERAFGRTVVQYDGGILPIVDLGELMSGGYDSGMQDLLPTVVCYEGTQQFGVIVSCIVDIIELPQSLIDAISGRDPGAEADEFGAGSPSPLVADGRVTELLDVGGAIRSVRPDLFINEAIAEARAAHAANAAFALAEATYNESTYSVGGQP